MFAFHIRNASRNFTEKEKSTTRGALFAPFGKLPFRFFFFNHGVYLRWVKRVNFTSVSIYDSIVKTKVITDPGKKIT